LGTAAIEAYHHFIFSLLHCLLCLLLAFPFIIVLLSAFSFRLPQLMVLFVAYQCAAVSAALSSGALVRAFSQGSVPITINACLFSLL
jgi:hypothetical protein